jgi:hypothetical protein
MPLASTTALDGIQRNDATHASRGRRKLVTPLHVGDGTIIESTGPAKSAGEAGNVRSHHDRDERQPEGKMRRDISLLAGRFQPEKFEDEYENALKELLRKKQKGERIERPKEPSRTNVVNLMDALRQSVKVESSGSTARRKISGSSDGRTAKKASRSASKQRKTG